MWLCWLARGDLATILAVLGRRLALLGALLAPPRRPWGASGRSRGASGALLGGFWALLGRTRGRPRAPDPYRERFWEDFGSTWGSIWVGLVTESGEFEERSGMRNYMHPEPSIYIYISPYPYPPNTPFKQLKVQREKEQKNNEN